MSEKHTDARGFFQELYHFNTDDWQPAQISWFSIEPGNTRGHHFHNKTQEMFIVLEGEVVYISGRVDSITDFRTLMAGEMVKTEPYDHHAFYSSRGAKILALSSRHFNVNDPDTFPSNATKSALKSYLKAS